MEYSVEAEKRDRLNDRKVARMSAITAFALLLTILSFIGYRIYNPAASAQLATEKETLIPLDAQLLEQSLKGSQSGDPAKTERTKTTPAQMEQILTKQNSSSHILSGNSNITNTNTPNQNPSGAKHVSDNPFGTGGINDGKFKGSNPWGMRDDQNDDPKPTEKFDRFLITTPNTHNIQSDENCKIVLSVIVDPEGTIVSTPTFVKNGSTTNDMALIEQVIRIVKSQAKYNKVNTGKNTKMALVIRITAS